MKKLLIFCAATVITANLAFSQGTAINNSGAAADSSAILDMSSSTQGLLIPRMTEAQKNAIARPAPSLLIYQLDGAQPGYYFNAGDKTTKNWMYVGGDDLGNHTATDSLDMNNKKIYNLATCTYNYDAANKLYVDSKVGAGGGAGGVSVTEISPLINSGGSMTWSVCADSCNGSTRNGKTDWRMPTADEIHFYRTSITPVGSWATTYVWSAKPYPGPYGYYTVYFINESNITGGDTYNSGWGTWKCRCVR